MGCTEPSMRWPWDCGNDWWESYCVNVNASFLTQFLRSWWFAGRIEYWSWLSNGAFRTTFGKRGTRGDSRSRGLLYDKDREHRTYTGLSSARDCVRTHQTWSGWSIEEQVRTCFSFSREEESEAMEEIQLWATEFRFEDLREALRKKFIIARKLVADSSELVLERQVP